MAIRMTRTTTAAMVFAVAASALAFLPAVRASIAYGSINNFDAVNDTGVPCHGFEIEIEDIQSRDITYTYDWNHYGVPRISENRFDPLHPRVLVRYASARNPDGTWAAYTAVPSGPIAPTDGHRFTDPSVNFGGEHFGVGFYGAPSAVRYFWLIDDGSGTLVRGGAVNIATPTFAYYPPAGGAPALVQAAIEPPPPPEPPALEFGEPSWVKETRTTTHNRNRVELRDLVSDDPDDPDDRNWQNGEPAEVEVEWQLLQTDYNSGDGGANGALVGAPEDLPNGDEVITRRYDFFKYAGPIDAETGEALADKVGPDGLHGSGLRTIDGVEVDLSTVVVVGDYIGAQMAGFDAAGQIGLVDHLQDGETGVPYVDRTVVVGGTPPIVTTTVGALPEGMDLDAVTGVLSGTPTASGTFAFTVHATDAAGGDVTKGYSLTVVDPGVVEPPHCMVSTVAAPLQGGSTSGDGEYVVGAPVTVEATANPGYTFLNWTDGGTVVSTTPSFQFLAAVNRELVASFARSVCIVTFHPGAHGALAGGTPALTVTVDYGAPAPAAPAVAPEATWLFVGWLPALPAALTAPVETVAQYAAAGPAAPNGPFLAVVDAAAAVAGRGWWDLSGAYATTVAGNVLALTLVHDAKGKIAGVAHLEVGSGKAVTPVPLRVKGSAKGSAGALAATLSLKGTDAAGTVSVALSLRLALAAAAHQLAGPVTGRIRTAAGTTAVTDRLALDLPASTDGAWTLQFQLASAGTTATGTARLVLSNGVSHDYALKGKLAGQTAAVALSRDPSDPVGRAIAIKAVVTPLTGGWARLDRFSGKGYGQTLAW